LARQDELRAASVRRRREIACWLLNTNDAMPAAANDEWVSPTTGKRVSGEQVRMLEARW
jgi:hypothetical protein